MNDSYPQQLVDLATPYWETEAELTRRFFSSKPTKEVWVRYLSAAVYKELNPVIGYGPTDGQVVEAGELRACRYKYDYDYDYD